MRLLVNTASTLKGGGVQVAKSFIAECIHFPEHEYHVILGEGISKLIDKKQFPANFHFYEIAYRPATRVFSLKGPDLFFRSLEARVKPDCVFTTSGPAYWRPKAPHLMGYNLPHYIYSDSPFFSNLGVYKKLYWKAKSRVIKHYVKHDADTYVVQTDDVKERLKMWIGSNEVYTITNTYGSHFSNKKGREKSKLPLKENGEYRLLMLSAWYKHKNFEIINSICDLMQQENVSDIKFVLTLPHEIYEKIFTPAAKNFIHNVGPVKPEECPMLYSESDAVFLPTLLECFSATYAEAMVMRKPIVTSDMGFAHTICGDAALYCDPMNAVDILGKIKQLKNSSDLQEQLVNKGIAMLVNFNSARERAQKYLELCNSLVTGK